MLKIEMPNGKMEALSGITVKSIILGSTLAVFNIWIATILNCLTLKHFTWVSAINPATNVYGDYALSLYIVPMVFTPLGIMVWACTIMLLINKSRPGTFTLQEAATVFTIVFAAGYLAPGGNLYGTGDKALSHVDWSHGIINIIRDPAAQDEMFELMPSLWPQKAISEYTWNKLLSQYTGVFGVYWQYWGGIFAWRWMYNLGGVCMFIGIATLLRRQFVEVESLPFPFATLATEVVGISQPGSSMLGNILRNKWFLIGFVIQGLWNIVPMGPTFLTNSGGRDTHLNAWLWLNPYRQPAWELGTMYPLLEVGGAFAYNAWPFYIAWMYLLPVSELAGELVGAGVLFLWMYIAFVSGIQWIYMGKISGMWGSTLDNPLTILLDKWYGFLFGFLIALVVIPAVTHRDLVLNSIKGIFNEPDDPRTPISYRATWLILTAGFVLYIIAGALMGIHIGAWILFVVTCSVLAIGLIRAVSANGGYFLQSWRTYFDGSWFSYIGVPIILLFGLTEANKTSLMSAFWMIEGDIARTLWGAAVSGILLLAFYKVGKLTKTKERSVLIGGAIGLALVSTLLVVFYAMHQQFMQAATVWSGGWSLMHLSDIWNRWKATGFEAAVLYNGMAGADLYSAPEYFVAAAMLGFVVLVVFSLLQRRFSWFIVSITGVFTGAMFGSILWMPLLMALLFKYLTLRVGGPRRYEQTGKPMAVGVLAGAAFVFVIQMLILYYNRVVILGYSAAA